MKTLQVELLKSQNVLNMHESLTKVLNNLLLMRLKADDAPCSSDQHWCDAISELTKLIPDYKTDNPEFISELEYVEINQKLLHGQSKISCN